MFWIKLTRARLLRRGHSLLSVPQRHPLHHLLLPLVVECIVPHESLVAVRVVRGAPFLVVIPVSIHLRRRGRYRETVTTHRARRVRKRAHK